MHTTRRQFVTGAGATLASLLAACGSNNAQDQSSAEDSQAKQEQTKPTSNLTFDSSAWQYDDSSDTYYQLGISYCETPADENYEQLAILVPGAYFDAEETEAGTYRCTPSASGTVGGFTAGRHRL